MRRAILIGIFLLAACQRSSTGSASSGDGSSGGSGGTPGTTTGTAASKVTLAIRDAAGASGPFALDDLEKLAIEVACVGGAAGDHAVRVDVVSPGGTLYAQLPATLVVDAGGTGSTSSTIQVRGSTIDTFRQVGTWQLASFVDGTAQAAASVDLTE